MAEPTTTIGWVAAIESEHVTVELDPATSGLVKAGRTGVLPVGSINSYITVPAGPHRVVAVITSIRISQRAPRTQDPYDVAFETIRELEATMVGRLDPEGFHPGLASYPPLSAPVSLATRAELGVIFNPGARPTIRLGEAVVAPEQDVYLDVNALLARHCAIVGSTGSGKSCSVAAIVEEILRHDLPYANVVIFDANGEFGASFGPATARGLSANTCIIAPEPGAESGLVLPHWFMNNEEHLALFRASEGAQAPLLQRAIADARLGSEAGRSNRSRLRLVLRVVDTIRAIDASGTRKPEPAMAAQLRALEAQLDTFRQEADENDDGMRDLWRQMLDATSGWSALGLVEDDRTSWDVHLNASQREVFERILDELQRNVREGLNRLGLGSATASLDFDMPSYYSLEDLFGIYLPARIDIEALNEPRVAAYAATLLMRLARLLADARYDFLSRVPQFPDALAQFLRLVLGHQAEDRHPQGPPPWADGYEARHPEASRHSVTVIDLSMVAFDVLEHVTALLARLLFDFAQRVTPRGSFPVLLVLEEAHRYVPRNVGDRPRSSFIFERVAKEGRKFGVSLMLATQRPSEVSETVLAQCGTLVAHRIVNQTDQDILRHATPFAARDVLRQLPGLATQHAIVVGEAVPAPVAVRVKTVQDAPMGEDPDFLDRWRNGPGSDPGGIIDRIARAWEKGEHSTLHESGTLGAEPQERGSRDT